MTRALTLSGIGLHSGLFVSVTLERTTSPVAFVTASGRAEVSELRTVRTDRGVRVECPDIGLDVDGVEHLLAALGGLGIRTGVSLRVDGPELPLADGAALEFCRALSELDPERRVSDLRIVKRAELGLGDSVYRFEPGEGTRLEVDVEFDARELGRQSASWNGSADAFVRDIAWARTFGFGHEASELSARGRARGATPENVLVLDGEGRVVPPGRPARPGELARHKLLDLVGDLYLQGGPPRGTLHARRPGHTATREIFERARAEGIVAPGSGPSGRSSL